MASVDDLLNQLSRRRSSDRTFNPYELELPLNNLRIYLERLLEEHRAVLAIGEAPGYLGCRHTGIPFTCGSTLTRKGHPLLEAIATQVRVSNVVYEESATHVWNVLRGYKRLPVLWNAFPFHPHLTSKPESNRTPNVDELREGREYLECLVEIFEPRAIITIGRKAESSVKTSFSNIRQVHVPHPARGKHKEFSDAMRLALRRFH